VVKNYFHQNLPMAAQNHVENLRGGQADPDALPNARPAYVAQQVGGGGFLTRASIRASAFPAATASVAD